MSLIKVANALHGIGAAINAMAHTPIIRNTAIGAAAGGVIGGVAGKKDHKLKSGLIGAAAGAVVGGGGTIAKDAVQFKRMLGNEATVGQSLKASAVGHFHTLKATPYAYKIGNNAGTANMNSPKFKKAIGDDIMSRIEL